MSTTTIIHKAGDSIRWHIKYKQADGTTPVDLTGFEIVVSCTSRVNVLSTLFTISSNDVSDNKYITKNNFNIGEFDIIIKDTSAFPKNDNFVDIQYIDANGFKQSAKTFNLKIVERL